MYHNPCSSRSLCQMAIWPRDAMWRDATRRDAAREDVLHYLLARAHTMYSNCYYHLLLKPFSQKFSRGVFLLLLFVQNIQCQAALYYVVIKTMLLHFLGLLRTDASRTACYLRNKLGGRTGGMWCISAADAFGLGRDGSVTQIKFWSVSIRQ